MIFSSPLDVFEALSELIILTASHCLHGKEIRSQLNEKVAQLYADLDGGFSHAAWLLPGWLPLPSFRYVWIRTTLRSLYCLCAFQFGYIRSFHFTRIQDRFSLFSKLI